MNIRTAGSQLWTFKTVKTETHFNKTEPTFSIRSMIEVFSGKKEGFLGFGIVSPLVLNTLGEGHAWK